MQEAGYLQVKPKPSVSPVTAVDVLGVQMADV